MEGSRTGRATGWQVCFTSGMMWLIDDWQVPRRLCKDRSVATRIDFAWRPNWCQCHACVLCQFCKLWVSLWAAGLSCGFKNSCWAYLRKHMSFLLSQRLKVKKNKNKPAEGISHTVLQYFKQVECREPGWDTVPPCGRLIFPFINKFSKSLGILAELCFGN